MSDIFTPLSDSELEQLEQFLLNRYDDDKDYLDQDEGVIEISELDGFFTAIVSGPTTIPPSTWLPALWGDVEPEWQSEKEFEAILTLLMRHMNSIASHLINEPETFEPLFLQREIEGEIYTIVDEWCEGYMRGVMLSAEDWMLDSMEMGILLAPIKAFQGEQATKTHEDFDLKEIVNLQNAITPNIREIHAYWLARREAASATASGPVRRDQPRIGRNDPCPCGSGKKYKKCCLH